MDQREVLQKLFDETQKALISSEDDMASNVFKAYQQKLNEIIDHLMAINQVVLNADTPSLGQWRQLQLDKKSIDLIVGQLTGFDQSVAQQLSSDLGDYAAEAYARQIWAIDQTTPPTIDPIWNPPTDAALMAFINEPWQGERFSDRLWSINNKMAGILQDTLRDGILAGDSIQDIARDMRSNTGVPPNAKMVTRPRASAQVYRAMLISRTEAMRLANQMQKAAWADNKKILTDRVWQAAPGLFKVCDDCADLDGKTEDVIGFMPPLHPNCRCLMMAVPKPFQELLGPGAFAESIDKYEMRVPGPGGSGSVAMEVQPYEEWVAA